MIQFCLLPPSGLRQCCPLQSPKFACLLAGKVAHLPMGLIGQVQVMATLGGIVHNIALALIEGPVGHQVWVIIANAAACVASRVLANALQRSSHTLQYAGNTQ